MYFMIICVFSDNQTVNKVQKLSNPEEGCDLNLTLEFLQAVVYFSTMLKCVTVIP